jgi:hypothetical protein
VLTQHPPPKKNITQKLSTLRHHNNTPQRPQCRVRLAVKTASIVVKCGAVKLAYNASWTGAGGGNASAYTVSKGAKFTFAKGQPAVVPFTSAVYVTA